MFRSIVLKSKMLALGLGLAISMAPMIAAQQSAAPAQAPAICGSQPLCFEAPDFAATITSFRTSTTRNNQKVIDATVRFQNKTNQPLVLGYVNESGIATDDRGNRLVPWGPNAYRGIGLVAGNNFEPKLIIRPQGWGDAQFELVQQGFPQVVGFTYVLDLTVAQINTLEGNQHTLGGEFPLHFEALKNGSSGASPAAAGSVAGASSVLQGMAGVAGSAHPGFASQAGAAAAATTAAEQQAQSTTSNDAATAATGVSSGASAVSGVAGAAGNSQVSGTAGRVSNTASAAGALAGMFHRKKKQESQTPQQQTQVQPQSQSQPSPQNQQLPSQAQPQMSAALNEPASGGQAQPWTPPADNSNAQRVALDPLKMPDVVGVHLGMTPQEALDALRKLYPKDLYQKMPDTAWPAAQKPDFGYNVLSSEPSNSPDVYLSFTAPPNPQVVWRVTRFTRRMHINHATLLAALREKYGKETVAFTESDSHSVTDDRRMADLYWLYDERGGRIPMPPAAAFPRIGNILECVGPGAAATNPQPVMPTDVDLIKNQYQNWCASFVGVHISIGSQDIVETTFTEMLHVPLAMRTAHAAAVWQRDLAERAHKEDLERSKQAKPSF
ncbi:MAG: hypothetical protein H6Q07_15 [Acidobacteria bacterium]|nr:hypothetical protein [Acidobacteriota bacterium]